VLRVLSICEYWSLIMPKYLKLFFQFRHSSWIVSFCQKSNQWSTTFWWTSVHTNLWDLVLVGIHKWTSKCTFCKWSFSWRIWLWKLLFNCTPTIISNEVGVSKNELVPKVGETLHCGHTVKYCPVNSSSIFPTQADWSVLCLLNFQWQSVYPSTPAI
jgi:hypothetical protein